MEELAVPDKLVLREKEGEAAGVAVATAGDKPVEEKNKEKDEEEEEDEDEEEQEDDDDDDKPLDPKKEIEAHILHRLDQDVVDWFINDVLKKAPKKAPTVDDIRAHPERFRGPLWVDTSDGHFPRVQDYTLTSEKDGATFPVRVYHPDPAEFGPGPYPVHLNYHGGGFLLGDLGAEAQLCLSMREAGVVVVDVNYRHCPETLWGRCFEDGWAALVWTRDSAKDLNIDPDSVSIGGISAGGHITLVVQQRARDAGIPLRAALPTVPPGGGSLFYKYYTDSPHPSFHEFVRTPILPWSRIQSFVKTALMSVPDEEAGIKRRRESDDGEDHNGANGTNGDAAAPANGDADADGDSDDTIRAKQLAFLEKTWPHAWIVPLEAPDVVGLCDTFVRTAELDLLRDEGEAYGRRLVAAGVRVTTKRYLGGLHTFMALDFHHLKCAFDADSIVALRQAHGLAALPASVVEEKVARVIAAVREKQAADKAKEKEEKDRKKKEKKEKKEKAE